MAFGKKKQKKGQAPTQVQQPSGVKVDRANNPFYPPRKESVLKEIGSTLGTVVVCLILVSVIVKNFNYMAIASRQDDDYTQDYTAEYEEPTDDYQDEYVEEVDDTDDSEELPIGVVEEGDSEEPVNDQPGKVIEEITATPTPEEGDYIIADSDVRYLTEDDLRDLTAEELRIARNEIYARHGRLFKDQALQEYFNSKPWYTGTIQPDNFTQSMLNEVEVANTVTITNYESKMGY